MNHPTSDPLTPDPGDNSRLHWLREAWKRGEEESASILAVLMAGIAMLFIAGIITAFMFAKDNAEERAMQQNAERAAASAAVTQNASGGSASRQIPPAAQPETTGAGSSEAGSRPAVHPREDEQNEQPWKR
jgi:hypothetical protein